MARVTASVVIVSVAAFICPVATLDIYGDANPYNQPPPVGTDPAFDCAWRKAAFAYAKKIQPELTKMEAVHDALQLSACGESRPAETTVPPNSQVTLPATGVTVYVSPKGADSAAGSETAPLATIQAAVNKLRQAGGAGNTVVLRDGIYRLASTLEIGPMDVNLTIQAYPGEMPWISGAVDIKPTWTAVPPSPAKPISWQTFNDSNNVFALNFSTPPCRVLGKPTSAAACEALCKATDGCSVWTWHDAKQGSYAFDCVMRTDGVWSPSAEDGHVSGRRIGGQTANLYVADVSAAGLADITGLRVDGVRATRARYPNVPSIETNIFPAGWISAGNGVSWGKPLLAPAPEVNIEVTDPNRGFMMNEFQNFELGVRGCCSNFDPQEGYWCSDKTSGGGAFTYRIPSGISAPTHTLPNAPYTDPTGAVVQAFRPGHWASWMFEVDAFGSTSDMQTLNWTKGGFQGARGSDGGAEWYIENVMEELDYPMEYFYDRVAKKLFFVSNTSASPQSSTFEVPVLQDLIKVVGGAPTRGTHRDPVVGFKMLGVGVKDAALTYFEPHSMPSGGDWALQRMGAVFFENTVGSTVESCTFTRNDGIAVMLSGFNREAVLSGNEVVWNGETAFAGWGYTDNMDGTSGEQPRGTVVANNLCHELGHFEKQSSCWFQAKAALTELRGNIMMNGPRALINFNDGFGGGNVIEGNLMFNANRETSDHGPFNSWDRQPYLTEILNGTASLVPKDNIITRNFMVANYGSNGGCIDNDDGSSFYNISFNFFVFGGHKSDFNGHNKLSWGNLNVYPSVYGTKCVGIYGLPNADPENRWNEGYWNNTCILPEANQPYLEVTGSCSFDKSIFTITMGGNKVYAPNANATVKCGKTVSFTDFVASGLDPGSTIDDAPTAAQIIAWGQALLEW
mmetsp:Transcript_14885/g.44162  ORF Transcript_14885/g.44162 Transcript_14885/m.44162 type:complete len:907 (-) Transcript_14885:74-2794(-)